MLEMFILIIQKIYKIFASFFIHHLLNNLITAKRKPCQPCQGPPTVGFCKRLNSGYTFDQDSNSCKRFKGPGCELTGNAFTKKEECESKCRTSNFKNTFTVLNDSYGTDTISMFEIG